MNASPITLTNGSSSYGPLDAGSATYLGSVYMTGNGETTVNFKPSAGAYGSGNVIGIWNAYNRVTAHSLCRDSNASWAGAAGWNPADVNSSNISFNNITWIDGWQQTSVNARFTVLPYPTSTGSNAFIGVDLDSTSSTPNMVSTFSSNGGTSYYGSITAQESFTPQYGVHYVQAMEDVSNSSATTFLGIDPFGYEGLTLDFDY